MPKFCNPADQYMKILAVKLPMTKKCVKKLEFLKGRYESEIKEQVENEIESKKYDPPNEEALSQSSMTGVCTQFKLLLRRERSSIARDPVRTKVKIF